MIQAIGMSKAVEAGMRQKYKWDLERLEALVDYDPPIMVGAIGLTTELAELYSGGSHDPKTSISE